MRTVSDRRDDPGIDGAPGPGATTAADGSAAPAAPVPLPLRRTPTDPGAPIGREGGALDDGTSGEIERLRGQGRPLPPEVRERMEPALGADLSRVRMHTGPRAEALNEAVSARAFTTGQDVFFGRGSFDPGTPGGTRLLAHELAHTLQQGDGVGRTLRRDVKIGREVYTSNGRRGGPRGPLDRNHIASVCATDSQDAALAKQVARWLVDGDTTEFESEAKLRAHVAELVDAIVATNPGYRVNANPVHEPKAWPDVADFRAEAVGDHPKLIRQFPQERGDMHDIRAALLVDPLLHVGIVVQDNRRLSDAAAIVDYYREFGDRVYLACGSAGLAPWGAKALNASTSTEMLFQAGRGPRGTRKDLSATLKTATTGDADVRYGATYDEVLTALHFPVASTSVAYALVNFRASGHGVPAPRLPSHPELDTGTRAFGQLWNAVKESGYWPVPVGTVPGAALTGCTTPDGDPFDAATHPHLMDYFRSVGPVHAVARAAADPLAKRQVEYGLFARLGANFPRTRAVGMRSGGLDAIAYAGIPSLSLDLAAEYDPAADGLDPDHGHSSSWKRAAKRELLLPGRFHQVFMTALRPLGNLADARWEGRMSDEDVARVSTALATFFGDGTDAGTTRKRLTDQPVPKTAPALLPQDVRNLMLKLRGARRGAGVPITPELAEALGIRKFA